MTVHDYDLPMRDNFIAREEFDGFQDLLLQFHHRPGTELENIAQQHFTLPEP